MKRLPTFLCALALLAGCAGRNNIERSCWMRTLPDDTPACMMSIPGAHDACTANVDRQYAYFITQALNLQGLWDAGVRAFDIRPASREDHLGVFHQMADTHVSFEDVLSILAGRLKDNPSEFAVVIMRHETEADLSDNFESLMGECLASIGNLAIPFRRDLTLGELRGHILFLSRSRYEGGPVGAYIQGWPDEAELVDAAGKTTPLVVQDYYEPEGREDKLEQIVQTYDYFAHSSLWLVNHCSAYVASGYGENSQNVNSSVADMIVSGKGKTGIMMMDFAGVDSFDGWEVAGAKLVDAIIENNWE